MDIGFLGCHFPWISYECCVFELISWKRRTNPRYTVVNYCAVHCSSIFTIASFARPKIRSERPVKGLLFNMWRWKMMPQGTCDQFLSPRHYIDRKKWTRKCISGQLPWQLRRDLAHGSERTALSSFTLSCWMFGARLFLMHPRNSVCGQSFQIFSSLSNSQTF